MSNPYLSICIPTYNRDQCLKECINSILISIQGYEHEIEIIISDNASTDKTSAVIADIQKQFPHIRYYRQEVNIGAGNNFYALVQSAIGEYVWVFGDDDMVLPHTVPIILSHLKEGYDFVISNNSLWTSDFSAIKVKSMMPIHHNLVFTDPNHLLASLGIHLSFISAVVIRKAFFLAPLRADYDYFAQYGMSFLYIVYASVATHCYGIYLSEPLVCNRDNPRDWSEDVWGNFYITGPQAIFKKLLQLNYRPAAIHGANNRFLRDYALRTILGRVRDGKNPGALIKLMFPFFKGYWFFWVACVPTVLFPPFILKVMTRLVRWRRFRYLNPSTNV